MMSQLQAYSMGNPVLASIGSRVSHLSRKMQDCRVCSSRRFCLAQQMMDSAHSSTRTQQNRRIYAQGKHIFRAGETSQALYVVSSGSVKSCLHTEDGDEQVLGFYLAGDVFGLDATEHQQHSVSALTLETTSICKLPFSQLSHRGGVHGYSQLISDQLARDYNLVLMLARKDADGRLASFICDFSDRFGARGYSANRFNLSMSRQDIGSYLGLAIETVSRTLTRFQDNGLLQVRRRSLEVLNYDALRKVAGAQAA